MRDDSKRLPGAEGKKAVSGGPLARSQYLMGNRGRRGGMHSPVVREPADIDSTEDVGRYILVDKEYFVGATAVGLVVIKHSETPTLGMSGDPTTFADEMVSEFNGLPVASFARQELADEHTRIVFLGVGNQIVAHLTEAGIWERVTCKLNEPGYRAAVVASEMAHKALSELHASAQISVVYYDASTYPILADLVVLARVTSTCVSSALTRAGLAMHHASGGRERFGAGFDNVPAFELSRAASHTRAKCEEWLKREKMDAMVRPRPSALGPDLTPCNVM